MKLGSGGVEMKRMEIKLRWPFMFLPGLIGLMIAGIPAIATESNWKVLLKEGESKAAQHQNREALELFRQANRLSPDNPEVLVQLTEHLSDMVDLEHSEPLARESLAVAKQAVAVAPGNSRAHVDLAIAYGKLTDFTNNKTKLEYSRLIKADAEKALELDPQNALAAHVLGRWHLGIATLNPVLKAMAQMVYGGMPPASKTQAVLLLKKAVDLAPHSIMYRRELAHAYTYTGEKQLARAEWEEILRLTPIDQEEIAAQQEARTLLKH